MPAGVWARSVSASEIEVNWQALSFTPERVLGYEVHFTLLNGNRNHTQHNSNACHPCCTSKPSLPNSALPWKWLFQLGDCYSQIYTVLCTNTKNMSKTCVQENKGKLPVHMPFRVAVSYGASCNTTPDHMSEYEEVSSYLTRNTVV